MVGISVTSKHFKEGEGLYLYFSANIRRTDSGVAIFIDKIEAARIAQTVEEARKTLWKRFRLAPMKSQK